MAINPPNFGNLNLAAGQVVVNLRNAFEDVHRFNLFIQNYGKTALVTLGFASADADLLLAVFGNLDQIRSAYVGGAYAGPALPFDFEGQTVPLWGGNV